MSVGPQPNVSGGLVLPFASGGLVSSAAGAAPGSGIVTATSEPAACFPPGGGAPPGEGGGPPPGGGVPAPPPGGGDGGGVTPGFPPGPGSPYSQGVVVARPYPSAISGLNITCAETGVTLASVCGPVTFYHDTPGIKHYSTPGGYGPSCDGPPQSGPWTPGSGSADVSEGLVIMVQL